MASAFRTFLGTILLILMVPTAALGLTTLDTTDTSHPWQTWVNQAQVPTWNGDLAFTVNRGLFDCGSIPDAAGCTSITPAFDPDTGQFTGGPPTAISTEVDASYDPRVTLYHELGQVFWAEYMTPADETTFMQIVGLPGDASDWTSWAYERATVRFPPYEWFAEGYRYCATYGVNQGIVNDDEGFEYPGDRLAFSGAQREVCDLIDTVGRANGVTTPPQSPAKIVWARRLISARVRDHESGASPSLAAPAVVRFAGGRCYCDAARSTSDQSPVKWKPWSST